MCEPRFVDSVDGVHCRLESSRYCENDGELGVAVSLERELEDLGLKRVFASVAGGGSWW